MTTSINPLYGQSNIDICLKSLGGLDNYVKFCNENKVTNLSTPKPSSYSFNNNTVKNKIIAGKNYATRNIKGNFFDPTFFDSTFFE